MTTAIARLRALAALPSSGTVDGMTVTADGMGGYTTSWTTGSSVACRVARVSSRRTEVPEGVPTTALVAVYLPYGTEVEPGDQITVDGLSYPVLDVYETAYGIYRTAFCGTGVTVPASAPEPEPETP